MNRSPSQPTLRDILRPVAAHRLLLLAVVAVAVGASVAYSLIKKPVYQAEASIAYQDPTYNLGLVGLAAPATQTPDQLAAAGAQTIIQPGVAAHVKQTLHSPRSVSSLLGSVTATVQPNSNLVVIQASAPTSTEAAHLGNAFANQGAAATNSQVRTLFRGAYRTALAQLRAAGGAGQALVNQDLSRLRILSTIATSAQVVKPAQLPSGPSSPKLKRDAALALVLGLVLGLLAIYIRDAFDRRLRSAGDVEQQFGLPLLGHVRTEALGRSPSVNGDRGVTAADWELFRILRRNFEFLEGSDAINTVAVTSSLPEEGKSTVAAFLAFTSAAAGKRTLLIESDLRRPSLADRLGVNSSPGLSDYVLGTADPSEIIQVIRFGDPITMNGSGPTAKDTASNQESDGGEQHMRELVCISAGTATSHADEIVRSEAFTRMLSDVAETYDLVVLDTPPLLSVVDTLEILPHADAALICVRVFKTTSQQASAGHAALKRLPERPTGLVITGTRRTTDPEYGYYGYYS